MNTNKGFGLHKETLFAKAPWSDVLDKEDEKERVNKESRSR